MSNKVDIQNIPIDIHANRLCDWLVSRHHCTKEWPEKVGAVRVKVNDALKDMPENATIGKILLTANPLNYFHCVKILEVLKETEADSKNIFGMYGSQRMKDWQDVLKFYQKDNLYLVEGASILARNVTYEIPAMKRLVTKCEQTQVECQKKEASCRKQAQEYRDKFMHSCTQLGLHFENFDFKNTDQKPPSVNAVGNQLVSLMGKELPEIFTKISLKSKEVKEAVEFYLRFLKSTIGLTSQQEKDCVPLLRLMIAKGNVTTYQYKHGEEPLKIEPPVINYTFEDDATESGLDLDLDVGAIDFGDISLASGDGADVELETGEIDWGGIAVDDVGGDSTDQIDFSVDIETAGIVLEEDGLEGGVARGEDAMTVLENPETRNFFIDELLEVEGFLSQRLEEIKNEKPNEVMLSSHGESLSAEALGKYLLTTTQVLAMFNETKTKQFLLVRESKRYIIRIAESLLQNLKLSRKLDFAAEEAKSKQAQLSLEIDQIRPKIQSLTKQSKELQAALSKEISIKYNNRQVYITGGV